MKAPSIVALIALGTVAAVLAMPHNVPKMTAAQPAYCTDKAAARLPECGWTEDRQRRQEEADAAAIASGDAYIRQVISEATSACDKPIAKMSMAEIEDCRRPGVRALRER
jgi:hypothetical protein